MTLHVVDFAGFTNGPDWKRKEIGTKLIDSFKECGFVKLINHDIPEPLVNDLSEWVTYPNSTYEGLQAK